MLHWGPKGMHRHESMRWARGSRELVVGAHVQAREVFCCGTRLEVSYDDHYTWRLALSSPIELGRGDLHRSTRGATFMCRATEAAPPAPAVQASAASDTTALERNTC